MSVNTELVMEMIQNGTVEVTAMQPNTDWFASELWQTVQLTTIGLVGKFMMILFAIFCLWLMVNLFDVYTRGEIKEHLRNLKDSALADYRGKCYIAFAIVVAFVVS
jgi:hypothetical protein